MDVQHQQLLLRCMPELLSQLENVGDLLDTLLGDGVLYPEHDDYQAICALPSPAEQKRAFLNLLPQLGPKAYSSFIRGLQKVRPHLADLLKQTESDMRIDNGGKFPPATPKSTLALRVQKSLRKHYVSSADEMTTFDYGRTGRQRRLHDVYVPVSSLDFDEVHEMRENSGDRLNTKPGGRQKADRRPFASRYEDAKELVLRRLVRFEDGQCANSCMVIGPGGVGKTLLLLWLRMSWAEGSVEELSEFEFVIYVSGHEVRAWKSYTAVDVLKAALKRYELSDAELAEMGEYLNNHSRRLLVLLDSADEVGEAWLESKGLENLFERRSIQDCSFIVASRPCSLAYHLLRPCKLRYYVVGFSDARLDELLVRLLGEDKGRQLAKLLKEESRIQLRELMKTTPLTASIVAGLAARLAAKGLEDLPLTMTHTYSAMGINLVCRRNQKMTTALNQRRTAHVACIDQFADGEQEMFADLGRMALKQMRTKCFEFDEDDVKQRCVALAHDIGILENFEYFSPAKGGVCRGVEFRHSSWGEWFAAYAVSLPPDREQSEPIRVYVDAFGVGEEMELFWKFAAGHAKGKQLQILMESLHDAFRSQRQSWDVSKRLLLACTCLAEAAQQPLRGNQSEDEKVKHVQTAAVAVLREEMDLSGMAMRVGEVKTLSVALEHAPHVSKLNISSCGFHAEHFRVLGSAMTHVQDMTMSFNPGLHGAGLAALVKNRAKHEHLDTLCLEECSLDEQDCAELNRLLSSLTSLTHLSLYKNHLGSVGLDRIQNYLVKSKLKSLDLSKNGLDGNAGHALGDVIRSSSHLKRLHVADNKLGNTGAEGIMEGVAKSNSLQHLDLNRTGIEDGALHSVSLAFECRSKKHRSSDAPCSLTVCLHGNHLNQRALESLARKLPSSCKDTIESDSTVIKDAQINQRDFSEFFKNHTDSSRKDDLWLSHQGIDVSGAGQISSLLTDECCPMEVLRLDCNSVGNEGAKALAGALEVTTALRGLSLKENGIGSAGFSALATAFTRNKSLLLLNFEGNPALSDMDEDVQVSLRSLVSKSSGLSYLGLASTGLGDDGCAVVGAALEGGSNMIFMTFSQDEIGDDGVAALCRGFERSTTLMFVDLSNNKITSKGAKTLRQCLQSRREQGRPLQRVWMGSNLVTEDAMDDCMVMTSFSYSSFTDVIAQYLQPHGSDSAQLSDSTSSSIASTDGTPKPRKGRSKKKENCCSKCYSEMTFCMIQ